MEGEPPVGYIGWSFLFVGAALQVSGYESKGVAAVFYAMAAVLLAMSLVRNRRAKKATTSVAPARVPDDRRSAVVVQELNNFRHRANNLFASASRSYGLSDYNQLASLRLEAYNFILHHTSIREAEMFADETNMMLKDLGGERSAGLNAEQGAVLNDVKIYGRRLKELIGRIDSGEATVKD